MGYKIVPNSHPVYGLVGDEVGECVSEQIIDEESVLCVRFSTQDVVLPKPYFVQVQDVAPEV